MIDEYIDKASIAIREGTKNIKKGRLKKDVYYRVVEEYFNAIYKYVGDNIDSIDANTLARIHSLESNLSEFIIPFETKYKAPNEVKNSDEYLLETIVYFTRKQLKINESVEFDTNSLRKYDKQANDYVKDMCDRMGIVCYSLNIAKTFDIPKNHNISIAKINNRYYLIDCTYQQYFLLGQNFRNRYLKSASHVVTCEIGARILGRNIKGAKELLERGFISTEDKMFEDYFVTMFNQVGKQPLNKDEYLTTIIKKKRKNT